MSKEIWLSEDEQIYLKNFVKNGEHKAKEIIRARVLLMLDRTGKNDHVRYNRTAEYAGISVQSVYNMRDEYLANQDINAYLTRKKRETPPVPAKVTGKVEAEIIALACSEPPEGKAFHPCRSQGVSRQKDVNILPKHPPYALQIPHSVLEEYTTSLLSEAYIPFF